MTKFFKNARKFNIFNNKTKKYIQYVIGEIILVVVGILIAIQINNWNEASKLRTTEINLLNQVKKDITINKADIENLTTSLNLNVSAIDSVLSALKSNSFTPKTSIFYSLLHGKSFLNTVNTGYKRIGNSEGSIIKNDTLLNTIIELYEVDFDTALTFQKQMHHQIENILYPFTNANFKVSTSYKINYDVFDDKVNIFFEPLDKETILQNNTFKNILFQLQQTCKNRLKHCEMLALKIDTLIEQINTEVNAG